MHIVQLAVIFALLALPTRAADERKFRLEVAGDIVASGLIGYLLPRFALKTGRRGEVAASGGDVVIDEAGGAGAGSPVMARGGRIYAIRLLTDNDAAQRFQAWLVSGVGQNTLASFTPDEGVRFTAAPMIVAKREIVLDGDPTLGRRVADLHCARCHRVHPKGTGFGIGSTPSFAALRTLPDWDDRFATFYARNPHPAFLRVKDLSPEFDVSRPPSIVPVVVTFDEVLAVQAYVAGLAPADLGEPVSGN